MAESEGKLLAAMPSVLTLSDALTCRYQVFIYELDTLASNSLIQWSRVLHEKLIVAQLVKKIACHYGAIRFIPVFTRACHWSLP
jgi:hypothetical protein